MERISGHLIHLHGLKSRCDITWTSGLPSVITTCRFVTNISNNMPAIRMKTYLEMPTTLGEDERTFPGGSPISFAGVELVNLPNPKKT